METNVQALKGLYTALGGEASDVADLTTSAEVITALEAVAEAAATELPAVKKIDAGKTLTVNGNGKWAAIMPESVIDDEEASETKTYSSSKIASLIPANELPAVTVADNVGNVLIVNDQGHWEAKEVGANLTMSQSDETTIALLENGETVNHASFLDVDLVGTRYRFFKSTFPNSKDSCQWINISRDTGKTVIRSFVVNKTDAEFDVIAVNKVEIADPVTPATT